MVLFLIGVYVYLLFCMYLCGRTHVHMCKAVSTVLLHISLENGSLAGPMTHWFCQSEGLLNPRDLSLSDLPISGIIGVHPSELTFFNTRDLNSGYSAYTAVSSQTELSPHFLD